ncbi:MAG: glycosyltransferase [Myxococcota bacterium]|nr:glycosyltransferase [Myxococcota bacterium]
MAYLQEVRVAVQPLDRFGELIGGDRIRHAMRTVVAARRRLQRRVVWNLNSTAVGGGVAEMLQSLLSYTRGLGIDTRWMVMGGNPDFFRVTKRLHHALHGATGDGSPLGAEARRIYEENAQANAIELASLVRPGDIVLLHDPQTAGMAPHLHQCGAHLVWRCHIGEDHPSAAAEEGWRFLEPYLQHVPLFVFSRETYVPEMCDHGRSVIITPSIDAFSAKNQALSDDATRTILVHTGLVEGPPPAKPDHGFLRDDGTPGRVERRADVIRLGRPPAFDTPLVVQVSRWDPLKDMQGVMEGFARMAADGLPDAELALVGPNVAGVTDDPEGGDVFQAVQSAWQQMPDAIRNRIHLVSLPTSDVEENAAIVNALQRHAAVVVQKSFREGFGLTVTEAMWKGRPVLASAVGGIQDQIVDGESGVLLPDPRDLDAFADALRGLLADPERRARLGAAAEARVRDHFLGIDHLLKYADLIERIDAAAEQSQAAAG